MRLPVCPSSAFLALLGLAQPGGAVRSVGVRADAAGSHGCSMVKGARSREGFHFAARCKCTGEESVLSEECGEQAGDRKFDITRLPVEDDGYGRSTIVPGCRCMVMDMSERGARPGVSKARELAAGRARSAPPTVIAEDCHPFGASYLRRWQACKCKKEEHLSFDCGKRATLRKFSPNDPEVKGSGCRCLSESELMRNKSFVGDLMDAPLPISKVPEPLEDEPVKIRPPPTSDSSEVPETPKCKVDPPEGFAFGDIVRIEKMIPAGHLIEILGVGLFPQSKHAKISGTIAQVVCSEGTSGTKGRVCLRKGNMGMKSLGCWSPSNLQKLE
ncbi:ANKRD52 [Symbiodinium microadriaticum]|nr:ANKRD52 [Symbiodinium microadriaticum]